MKNVIQNVVFYVGTIASDNWHICIPSGNWPLDGSKNIKFGSTKPSLDKIQKTWAWLANEPILTYKEDVKR